jgi:predicted nucleic acid-binding protein
VTDASLVVLADRHRAARIGTYDRRHFTTMRDLNGRPFELLP